MEYGWPDTVRSIARRQMAVPGRARALIHPIHIRDIVAAIEVSILNENAFGRAFNIAGPRALELGEVFGAIANEVGAGSVRKVPYALMYAISCALQVLPRSRKPGHLSLLTPHRVRFFSEDHAYDTTQARDLLGFSPAVDIDEGVREMVEWCRERRMV